MCIFVAVNLKEIEKKKFIVKEGCQYKVKIYFYVQRDIVQGLKYIQKTYRAGIKGQYINILTLNFYFTIFSHIFYKYKTMLIY